MWNTKRPQPPPNPDIWHFVYAHVFKKYNFWVFLPNKANLLGRILPKLSKGISSHQDLSFELKTSLYDLSLKSFSPYINTETNRCFWTFWRILPFPVAETVKRHIYSSRPFIWAHYQVECFFLFDGHFRWYFSLLLAINVLIFYGFHWNCVSGWLYNQIIDR